MKTTVALVLLAVLSVALFFHETRIERECVEYHAPEMSCVAWGSLYAR